MYNIYVWYIDNMYIIYKICTVHIYIISYVCVYI